MRLRGGGGGWRVFPEHRQKRLLSVRKAVVGQVLAVATMRGQSWAVERAWNRTDRHREGEEDPRPFKRAGEGGTTANWRAGRGRGLKGAEEMEMVEDRATHGYSPCPVWDPGRPKMGREVALRKSFLCHGALLPGHWKAMDHFVTLPRPCVCVANI